MFGVVGGGARSIEERGGLVEQPRVGRYHATGLSGRRSATWGKGRNWRVEAKEGSVLDRCSGGRDDITFPNSKLVGLWRQGLQSLTVTGYR